MKRFATMVIAGLALAGCGSGTKTRTVTVPAGTAPPSTTAPPTTSAPTTTAPRTAPSAHPPTLHLTTFRSPSGNIGCIIAATARCDIRDRSWSAPSRPASCPTEVDFGQGLIVGHRGNGRLVCAGDTAMNPRAAVLRYGFDTSADGFRCQSRTSGMTCRSLHTAHGFFISIQSYRTF